MILQATGLWIILEGTEEDDKNSRSTNECTVVDQY